MIRYMYGSRYFFIHDESFMIPWSLRTRGQRGTGTRPRTKSSRTILPQDSNSIQICGNMATRQYSRKQHAMLKEAEIGSLRVKCGIGSLSGVGRSDLSDTTGKCPANDSARRAFELYCMSGRCHFSKINFFTATKLFPGPAEGSPACKR